MPYFNTINYSFLMVAENKEQRQIPNRESRNIKSMEERKNGMVKNNFRSSED